MTCRKMPKGPIQKKVTVTGIPENACLLVKMEGDDRTYAVELEQSAVLMLVRLAAGYSKDNVLSLVPFDGVTFKKRCVACKETFTPTYDGESICLTCHDRNALGDES